MSFNSGLILCFNAYMDNLELRKKLDKCLEVFHDEMRSLRIGRASADMVEHLQIEVYGSKLPLLQVASVQTPQHDQIIIQPWDAQVITAIVSAIRNSDLNLNPSLEGNIIRITLPPVTEERRAEAAKLVKRMTEDARISVRNVRDEAMKDIEAAEKNKDLSEDEAHARKEDVQKFIDEYNTKIKTMAEKKEEEIMQR